MEVEEVPPKPPDPPNDAIIKETQFASKRRLETDSVEQTSAKKTVTSVDMAAASIQTMYVHPSVVVGSQAYSNMDQGPFIVHVSRAEPDPAAGLTIRPIKFGQFLFKNRISNICPDGVKRVGRNKIAVEFRTHLDANGFVANPLLSQNKYVAVIPNYNITRMGLVRDVPVDFSMEEFAENVDLPAGCGHILKARRLNRKVINDGKASWIPTQTVVLTFRGQMLPERIFSFHTSMRVEVYQYPTIQCLNCCRFGHIKAQCRSKQRCFRCAQPHSGDSCDVVESNSTCLYCSGRHFANNKCCPEQSRQISIKKLMAEEGMSYMDAANRLPQVYKRYTEVAQTPSNLSGQSEIPTPMHNNPTASTQSHTKTVYAARHPRAPLGKSYDKVAHQAIVGDVPSDMPNGCALQNPSPLVSSQNENLIQLLLKIIIDLITQNNTAIPSNVASTLSTITSLLGQYGPGQCSAMEQPQSASKDA